MLPRLTALLALALGLLRIAALSLHPDKLIADAPFSLADEVEYDARSIDLRSAAEKFERTHDRHGNFLRAIVRNDSVRNCSVSRTTRVWTSSCVRSAGGFLSVAKMWA